MKRMLNQVVLGAGALMSAGAAMAHTGHGVEHAHWHASDLYGFVVVAALAAAAIWFSRGE